MAEAPETVRIIRVFVSSPGDVTAERAALNEIVSLFNRATGPFLGVRLELWQWEKDLIPNIGPKPQQVVDDQLPRYDVYLGIMSARFGTPTNGYGSGTEKEFSDAVNQWEAAGTPWITFYFDNAPTVSRKPKEALQYVNVCEFREKLEKQGIVSGYTGVRGSEGGLYERVLEHLTKLAHQLASPAVKTEEAPSPSNPSKYLRDCLDKTSHIYIRGLQEGSGKANRFPIEDLYISLTTTGLMGQGDTEERMAGKKKRHSDRSEDETAVAEHRDVPLQEALRSDRLAVVGDPGSGKTTFLRRISYALCQTQLADVPKAAEDRLGIRDRTFPIFVRLSEMAQHMQKHDGENHAPEPDSPLWLPLYLGTRSNEYSWGLDAEFFRQQLEDGLCTVLLDGLDEAPNRIMRQRLSRLIENTTTTYRDCRFVVTSRPAAYKGEVVLSDFDHARIDSLSDKAVETFLSRWCGAAYPDKQQAADEHYQELLSAVRGRIEIRRMARNPVMLTALAVVHWNERRLPEQRADLYKSIITWLARSREQRRGRETADRTVVLLQELALAMQDASEGRKTQVTKRWAAEKLADQFDGGAEGVRQAESFLDQEEVDSGIIVGRGNEVTYWHLTFQEFLAAKAIASRLDDKQHRIIFADPNRVHLSSWREVVLLLAGELHQQGKDKVNGLIHGILQNVSANASLAEQARCAGLVGAVLRDLEPLRYRVSDPRYHTLLTTVMAIFDAKGSQDVPVEERISAADALGQAGDRRIDFASEEYWVTIPAGKFLMGAQKSPDGRNYDQEAEDWESPVHEVYLDEYRIARYPVTVGQYGQFVKDDGYAKEKFWLPGGFGQFEEPEDWEQQVEYPSRPVVGVSWYEAAAFSVWAGFRLPTEAEWERAARGTEGRKYPWGSEPTNAERLNFKMNVGNPTPVGIFPSGNTPEGISDMAGNVWEWCWDWFGDYVAKPVSNPQGPDSATYRVYRGGSWNFTARNCRSAYRNRLRPDIRDYILGFRVALGLSSESSKLSVQSRSEAASAGRGVSQRSEAEPKPIEPKRKA